MKNGIRQSLSFGFEQTFTTADWWTDPGFVATSNTPLKLEKMKLLAEKLAQVTGGRFVRSEDMYKHLQYETFLRDGSPSFVVTMDPGSIEVKSPAMLIEGMEEAMRPLFEAADLAGVVPYRNWWYGIKTGTEGGCHVNMAGFTPESNPLRADPRLVIAYAAFFHNNPSIHYPFMGVDVGPGGNCMRMDEHALDPHSKHAPGALDSIGRFEAMAERINRGEKPTASEVEAHFKGSKLAEDKHSAPSLYKFKAPAYFIEDRAVESLREPLDFYLVSDLRLRILESFGEDPRVEPLREYGPELHREHLCSAWLWREFGEMADKLGIRSEPYRRFFDRQFPILKMGDEVPKLLEVREGRRPRIITDIKMRGELIISKTVDTSFARLEMIWEGSAICAVNGSLLAHGELMRDGKPVRCLVLDYKKQGEETLDIALVSEDRSHVLESARFSPKDMMFRRAEFEVDLKSLGKSRAPGGARMYFNFDA
jgi:hypothetical protein